jgi:hypothetical protein
MLDKKHATLGINMPKEMAAELQQRAASMQLSVSKYCKLILKDWMESGKKLQLTED